MKARLFVKLHNAKFIQVYVCNLKKTAQIPNNQIRFEEFANGFMLVHLL